MPVEDTSEWSSTSRVVSPRPMLRASDVPVAVLCSGECSAWESDVNTPTFPPPGTSTSARAADARDDRWDVRGVRLMEVCQGATLRRTGSGLSLPLSADPFVGPDGTLYVAWKDPANEEIAMTASSDGGLTFGHKVTIGPAPSTQFVPIPAEPHALFQPSGLGEFGAFPYPACGADTSAGPRRGTLYCSWMDETASNGTDIFVARSTDHGQTWSPRVRVNDDSTGVANDQFGQWLSVDPMDGSVSVSWCDTRNDPTHLSTDVFYGRSTDGGLAFSPNLQVTTAPTNEACADCGNRFYGDYQGIAAFGGVVHLVWTDRRASVAALDEEVFTATITIKSS